MHGTELSGRALPCHLGASVSGTEGEENGERREIAVLVCVPILYSTTWCLNLSPFLETEWLLLSLHPTLPFVNKALATDLTHVNLCPPEE